tara:strand:+ start:859 stop:1290 length:432 start_codon:yes stop_codon:yes gene_type:complete
MIHSGGFINPDSWGDEWRRRLKGSKLEGLFRPHDLRHTHATHIMAQTGNPKIVQARLGHGDIKTSMGYMHRIPQQDKKAVEKFETMVREAVEKYQSQLDKKIENCYKMRRHLYQICTKFNLINWKSYQNKAISFLKDGANGQD